MKLLSESLHQFNMGQVEVVTYRDSVRYLVDGGVVGVGHL